MAKTNKASEVEADEIEVDMPDMLNPDWDDIKTAHPSCNFWVRAIARVNKRKVFVAELNATMSADIPDPRATAITITIPGRQRNSEGRMVDAEFSETIDLPFTTFDNAFVTRRRMKPEVVALAVYQMACFGHSIEFEPMQDVDVRAYAKDKKSPQVREAIRKAMDINPSAIMREQEKLEVQSATGGAKVFGMPNFVSA